MWWRKGKGYLQCTSMGWVETVRTPRLAICTAVPSLVLFYEVLACVVISCNKGLKKEG